ncbi:septal ring lytic transglycosylase RlpA family protein [Martelella soudanensis]|uniref:septal ring lytic transglycosylase RlpA family protein n=1 Tax=unclassified Martelella TaxID=2629616 RepID=UPI0015DDD59B|nr:MULTISPECIES: septal ring lytic transglycosylase RlpA family protein [unclassified Martelella]
MKEIRFSTSLAMLALTALMASCTTTGDTSEDIKDEAAEVADAAANGISEADALAYQKIGKPYQVRGKWYTPKSDTKYSKTGLASWYGPKFNGGRTASGEIYDMYHLSAAHKTLPLPSYVRVTNLDNDSSVIVRVNDRGPFVSGRIIDLSKKAAEMLKMTGAGVANVRVDYVGPASRNADDMNYLVASYEKKEVPEGVDPGRFGEVQVANAETPAAIPAVAAKTEASEKPVEVAEAPVKPEPAPAQLALVEEAKPVTASDAGAATESILADNTGYAVPIPFKR